jgi:hypothetical protein
MANNIKVLAATGDDTVAPPTATNDIAGVHFQKIKAGWGVNGVFQETADTDGVRFPIGGAQLGALTEAAPASDTASAGLNGRLQRIAQRLTSMIAQLPATLGQKAMAASLSVVLASDQTALATNGAGIHVAATSFDAGSEADTDEGILGATAGARLMGFSAKEMTGSNPALLYLRNGTSNVAPTVVICSLSPNESVREWYGPDGIASASGIWLERSTGLISVVVYYKVVA